MTLKLSNEEINDIMKRVKSLQESGLLAEDISQTIMKQKKNKHKNQKKKEDF